jgi:hypothetical protein
MNTENAKATLEAIEKLLPIDMIDSKCWKQGDVIEKIECLLEMNQSRKQEIEQLYESIELGL